MIKNRKAFTIVELVIVIAVIGILAGVLIPTFSNIIKNAHISNDQQVAGILTKDLLMANDGVRIEDEATLMDTLNKIENIDEKLTPQSLQYGYHFWFDMDEQKVIVGTVAEVAEIGKESLSDPADDPGDNEPADPVAGVAAVSSVNAVAQSSFNGLRNLFEYNRCFLITSETALGSIFGDMSAIKYADGYEDFIEELEKAARHEIYGEIATVVLNNFKRTVVINSNGVFYYESALNSNDNLFYFASDLKIIKANQYKYNGENATGVTAGTLPTPKNNEIALPSSVILIEEGALNFATARSVEVKTTSTDYNQLKAILSPNCSNAVFVTTDGKEYIVTNETRGNETVGVLHEVTENETVYVCDLVRRVPFVDYSITSGEAAGLYSWMGDENTGYTFNILINQSGKVVFYAKETGTQAQSLASVEKWSSSNPAISVAADGTLSFVASDLDEHGYTATITAKTYNILGDEKIKTFTVQVVKPTAANVVINGKNFSLDGVTKQITLTYDGSTNPTYDVTLNGTVAYSPACGIGTNSIAITTGQDSMIKVTNNKTLSFDTSKTNNTFTVSVDGCLATTFTVNLNDTTLADFTHTFHKDSTPDRPYYLGEGNAVLLSSFLKLKDGKSFNGAKITVYDRVDSGIYYDQNEISKTPNGVSATYPTTAITSVTAWNAAEITFEIDKDYADYRPDKVHTVYVEVTDSKNVSVIFAFNLAEDAINVVGSSFASLSTVDSDIVLHGDVASVPNTTKISLGSNTLYGNGYIINATSYKSTTNTAVNDYFISVGGGTIDNVYINGPVYPDLEYITASQGYYVSGIKAESIIVKDENNEDEIKPAIIKNSYISGFRQPVQVSSGTVNVTNTTLYGGTYANLQLIKGILNLHDVTTVQPEDGIPDTFNPTNSKKNVIGLGIAIEKDASADTVASEINITGYLDQYNWVPSDTEADLPVFKISGTEMDFQKVLAAMFNGINIRVYINMFIYKLDKTIDDRLAFLDAYLYDGKYLNTGIIFLTIETGNAASDAKTAVTDKNNPKVKVNDKRNGATSDYMAYKKLESTPLPLFSAYPLLTHSVLTALGYENGITAAHAMKLMDNLEVSQSGEHKGKLVGNLGWGVLEALGTPIDAFIDVWSYKNDVAADSDFGPIQYTEGYYVDYVQ